MRHPKTGEHGVWVSEHWFKELDFTHAAFPQLKAQVAALTNANEQLRLSLKLQVRTTTLAEQRANLWEARADKNFKLYEGAQMRLLDGREPWWARVLVFTLGAASMALAVELAQRL